MGFRDRPLAAVKLNVLPTRMEQLGLANQSEQNDVHGKLELPSDVRSIEPLKVALDLVSGEGAGSRMGTCGHV